MHEIEEDIGNDRSNLLFLGFSSIPVGRSLLLSGNKRNKVLLVQDALVCASSGLASLLQFGNLGGLLSNLAGLGESSVLFSHNNL